MSLSKLPRRILGTCAIVVVLAGCGPAQVASMTPEQNRALAPRPNLDGSWVAPALRNENLLYAANAAGASRGTGTLSVYSYPRGKLVGNLTGFTDPRGLCIDKAGDVFVTNFGDEDIIEYAHGGTTPIQTLSDAGMPFGCAIDPTTGNLAVANWCDGPVGSCFGAGTVLIYEHAQGTPKTLEDRYSSFMYYCTYDKRGNLFVDGIVVAYQIRFTELPKGQSNFKQIGLSLPGNPPLPAALQWVGKQLVTAAADGNALYEYRLRGSQAELVHTTRLRTIADGNGTNQFLIWKDTAVAEELSTSKFSGLIKLFAYPSGGKPTKVITKGLNNPVAAVISVPKT